MKHVRESDLALYASGDLSVWPHWTTALHVRRCGACRELVGIHRALRADARDGAGVLPESVNWERLSAEMTANIHVGLAAGQCVTPAGQRREKKFSLNGKWVPVATIAGLALVFTAAWWLNVPAGDKVALGRVLRGLPVHALSDDGPAVVASPAGIEFRENGSSLGLAQSGAELVGVSLSAGGSASARYVDGDTGQVTITTVYVQ
jgi:hypothetical protein